MATTALCRSCARAVRSSQPLARTHTHIQQTRNLRLSAPLYLDFLAPSWRPTPNLSKPRPTSSSRPRLLFQPTTVSSIRHATTKALINPRQDDSGNDRLITITPRAAHRLQKISQTDANPDLALRVSVESGGCHGFQYLMTLINVKTDVDAQEDTVFEDTAAITVKAEDGKQGQEEEGYRAKVVMDEPSLELLSGSSIDYTMELIGSQFKVVGIPGAKSSCGCGTSFDIA